jgi:hypothetical protein
MDKPANVLIEWQDGSGYWGALAESIPKASLTKRTNGGIAILPVKDFNLADHQFVYIKVVNLKGNKLQMWIPRELVKMISQGEADLTKAFSFAGGKIK